MRQSESIKSIAKAMAEVQKEIQHASFDSNNPHFRSDYASLESHLNAIRPLLPKNGLSFSQGVSGRNLEMIIMHESGEFIAYDMELLVTKNDMQALGSAITYGRRYLLASAFGIGSQDDDAESAVGRDDKAQQGKAQSPEAPSAKPESEKPKGDDILGAFTVKQGKYKGKRLDEIGEHVLDKYIKDYKAKISESGRSLYPSEAELFKMGEAYLKSKEFNRDRK